MATIATRLKNIVKDRLLPGLFHLTGGSVLGPDELRKAGIDVRSVFASQTIPVPAINNDDTTDPTWNGYELTFQEACIYRIDADAWGDCLNRWGTVMLPERRIVATGADVKRAVIASMLPPCARRAVRKEQIIIAPWPHLWLTYGDLLIAALPKLCRLVSQMSKQERDHAVVLLPYSIMGEWAYEFVEMLGFGRERQIDMITERVELAPSGTLITGNGPSQREIIAHPGDVACMSAMIRESCRLQPGSTRKKRYFISRAKSGRRRLMEEEQVFQKLEGTGIEWLADVPRSAREQIELFGNAQLLVGAHGAGLANLVWSSCGAAVVEAMHPAWFCPCYRILCAVQQTPYAVLYDRSGGAELRLDADMIGSDIRVAPDAFAGAVRAVIARLSERSSLSAAPRTPP